MSALKTLLSVLVVVALSSCKYDHSLLDAIRQTFNGIGNHQCFGSTDLSDTSRVYDFPCGIIATSVCRDDNQTPKVSGVMRWTIRGADGKCVEQPKCVWQGFQNTQFLDAEDCITRWRNDTFQSVGCFEGIGGQVECPGYPNG